MGGRTITTPKVKIGKSDNQLTIISVYPETETDSPWVDVWMLLGWLGELFRMVEVVLLFWMALVPSRGRELVECCLEAMI